MTPRARRRAIAALALAGLVLCGWLLHVERAGHAAHRAAAPPRLPTMTRSAHEAPRSAPVRTDDAFASIQCTLRADPDAPPAAGTLRAIDVETGEQRASTPNGNDLVLTVPEGRWTLRWDPEGLPTGYRLGTVDLVDGDVFRCALAATGVVVHGRVVDPDGAPLADATTQGCGPPMTSDVNGAFTLTVPFQALRGPDGRCALRARWSDGLLSRYSEPATVSLLGGDSPVLTVDPKPVAGMGITLREGEDGLYVGYVHPGTPAEAADLRVGDVLLSVDGHDTAGMSTLDFIPYGVGDEGTTVLLEIQRGDEVLTRRIRRARIERPDQPP